MPAAPTTALAAVLAHQGGWDEALMVLVPIALIVWVLKVANDRAKRQRAEADAAADADGAASPAAHEAGRTDEP